MELQPILNVLAITSTTNFALNFYLKRRDKRNAKVEEKPPVAEALLLPSRPKVDEDIRRYVAQRMPGWSALKVPRTQSR